jgi:LCP family protein required for cell wall assembly
VLAAVVLAATGIAWGTKEWANNQVRDVDALDPNSAAIVDKAKQAGDENFLLVGSDSRAGAQPGDNIGNTNLVPGARSDSVMVVHLPADRSRMVIVSFPRDLEVNRAACQGWDSATGKLTEAQAPADPVSKLNEAYAVGGPKCTLKVIQQISGLKINHFMGVDFQGFKAMVDAMQGVSVCVEHPIIDAELGVVVPKAGTVQLAGDQALNFVRARHVAGDPTSDYGRIRRQQRFISALMRKAASGSVLLDPGKLKAFVTAMAGSTFTDNLDIDQMLMLGQSMQNLDTGRVTFVTLPTTGIANARGNEVLRADQAKALFTAVINGTPLPGEAPAPAGAPATPTGPAPQPSAPGVPMPFAGGPITVAPQDIKLQVVNAAGKDGLANRLTTALQGDGFTVVKQGSTAPSPTSVIRYSTGHEAEAATVAAAVPSAQLLADQSMGGALELTVGTDYNGVVLPVRAGTTAPPSGVQRSGLAAPAGPPAGALPQGLQTINAADARCS